jgi:hypothetical protein
MEEVEDGGSTKVFVSGKGFRRRTELALKIKEASHELAQIRSELYRLVPEAGVWKISQSSRTNTAATP